MCTCDTPEFSRRTEQRSRKQRRCGECKKTIEVGDLYVYEAQKFDGRMWVDVSCKECGDWIADLFAEVDDPCCDMPNRGELRYWMTESDNAPMIAAIEERRRAAG